MEKHEQQEKKSKSISWVDITKHFKIHIFYKQNDLFIKNHSQYKLYNESINSVQCPTLIKSQTTHVAESYAFPWLSQS